MRIGPLNISWGRKSYSGRYVLQGGRFVSPSDNKESYIANGYSINDIVYSIVNIILDKVRLPEWELFKVVDESSLKKYNQLMRVKNISSADYKKALRFKEQALEPIKNPDFNTGKLNDLLKYPNESDTFQDYIASGAGYKLLTGDIYDWATLLNKGVNQGIPSSLYLLPSQCVIINTTSSFPLSEQSYEITSVNQKFTKEEVLHERYFNPNWSVTGNELYGMSPLKAALKNIGRNNAAKDSSSAKFTNGGLESVLYMDDQRYSAEEGLEQANALKSKLVHEYSGPTNQGKIAISGVKVGAVPLGLSPVELGIIESEKWDAIMFCNIYGVPPEMLGLTQKTYNNVKEAEKALTTRSAIPLLTSRRNSFNRKLQTDWGFKGKNVYLDYSTECFTELQIDKGEVADWTSKVIAITPNEQRELIGLDSIEDESMNELWVLNGSRTPISDYQQNQLDQVLNNEYLRSDGQGDSKSGKE